MTLGDFLILAGVALLLFVVVRYIMLRKKNHKCSGCQGCALQGHCDNEDSGEGCEKVDRHE